MVDETFKKIEKNDILNILNTVKNIEEPKIPFPQADNFNRIIFICEALLKDNLSFNKITEINNFTSRQTGYYTNACMYLNLIEKYKKNNSENKKENYFKLTECGNNIFKLTDTYRNLKLCECIFQHAVFHHIFNEYLKNNNFIDLETIVKIMYKHNLYNIKSPQLYRRRGQTIQNWINWIINLY